MVFQSYAVLICGNPPNNAVLFTRTCIQYYRRLLGSVHRRSVVSEHLAEKTCVNCWTNFTGGCNAHKVFRENLVFVPQNFKLFIFTRKFPAMQYMEMIMPTYIVHGHKQLQIHDFPLQIWRLSSMKVWIKLTLSCFYTYVALHAYIKISPFALSYDNDSIIYLVLNEQLEVLNFKSTLLLQNRKYCSSRAYYTE